MTLDLDFVRSHFPALEDGYVYMDNAGGSQIPKGVADLVHDYLLTSNVQHGASYEKCQIAMKKVAAGREAMRQFINAERPEELVIGASTTITLRLLADAFKSRINPGDEIIVTNFDHEANGSVWRRLENLGAIIKEWQIDPDTLEPSLDDLARLMTEKTRLVCFPHVSNILGTIHPVRDITRLVHERGAKVVVDGVAYAPHRLIDVRDWDVDFYVFSTYKTYGPHQSVLYGKYELLKDLDNINHLFIDPGDIPRKLQPGDVNFELNAGLKGITDYFGDLARHHGIEGDFRDRLAGVNELISRHEEELQDRLLSFLKSKQAVRIIGSPSADSTKRVPTISFVLDGQSSQKIVEQVDPHGIGIRFGSFYSNRLTETLGLPVGDGVIRASFVHYNTLEEVDRLIGVLDELI